MELAGRSRGLARACLGVFGVGLLAAFESCASPPPPVGAPKRYRAPFTTTPIVLDGKLDDAAWKSAPWSDDFVDIQGSSKPAPRFRTHVKLLWDEERLYVGAELEEPDVWATLTKRDEIVFHDDDFELFVDPDGDGRAYYELETNCLGTIFDLFLPRTYREGGPAVHSWNCAGLVTKVDVQGTVNDPRDRDRGWTVEWAIPWRSLVPPDRDDHGSALPSVDEERRRGGAAPKVGATWRVNFSRVEWKLDDAAANSLAPYVKKAGEPEDNWVWSPQGVVDMHVPDRWGEVTFVRE